MNKRKRASLNWLAIIRHKVSGVDKLDITFYSLMSIGAIVVIIIISLAFWSWYQQSIECAPYKELTLNDIPAKCLSYF
jgi:hypothetical protein